MVGQLLCARAMTNFVFLIFTAAILLVGAVESSETNANDELPTTLLTDAEASEHLVEDALPNLDTTELR